MTQPNEHLSRLEMMAGGSPKWDLSPNDIEALRYALDRIRDLGGLTAERDKYHAQAQDVEIALRRIVELVELDPEARDVGSDLWAALKHAEQAMSPRKPIEDLDAADMIHSCPPPDRPGVFDTACRACVTFLRRNGFDMPTLDRGEGGST